MQKTHPYITLKRFEHNLSSYDFRAASIKRDWLDETYKSHGYMCQPVSTAGLNGWEFVLKNDIKVIWDGVSSSDKSHVTVTEGALDPDGGLFVDTGAGHATINFNINAIIETDPDHHVWLTGAPNIFIDGIQPMTVLLQSDWYHHNSIQYAWKITRPNTEITIPAGTPFMFMMIYPKGLVEQTKVTVSKFPDEDLPRLDNYGEMRNNFYAENEPWKWSQFYKRGVGPFNEKHLDKPFRPCPSQVIYEVERDNE